jgi:hypothetical protein
VITNGMSVRDLEFEERAFLRTLRRSSLARVVDGRVQLRNPSDAGYPVSYDAAVSHGRATAVIREWLAAAGMAKAVSS